MSRYKNKLIIAVVILCILGLVYCWEGVTPNPQKTKSEETVSVINTPAPTEAPTPTPTTEPIVTTQQPQQSETPEPVLLKTQNPIPTNEPVTETTPMPTQTPEEVALTCTLSVRCDTILSHMDWLDAENASLIPTDGIIFPETTVPIADGESVFDVLLREMTKHKIHLEFVKTPVYQSTYIEGIHNLYEFDCGNQSGWMYRVDGAFPNYGCSQYILHGGEKIEWVYTCDLGRDVGNETQTGFPGKESVNE
ncbi:MAG: DUF4430 domain-containing protein [Ruminococcaceae bacterium]|nr:DUF4430 domain-containing protein [Oscillospiraceae bacterium]